MNLDTSSIERLVGQSAAGDREAFDRLLAEHRDELRSFVSLHFNDWLRGRADESDVVQEVSLVAYQRMEDFAKRRPMPFRLWLRKTALDRLKDLRRKHHAQCRDVSRQETFPPHDSGVILANTLQQKQVSPSSAAEKNDDWHALLQAIELLPDEEREVLLLCYVDELSQSEAAYVLGVSTKTISKRHTSAVQRLATLML